jgi:xanthine dehydrogenase accessory factor
LSQRLTPSLFDAAVIMSHNLSADATYLRALSTDGPSFIGLLGPASRRARLLKEAGPMLQAVAGRIRGPVGLGIGAKTPAGIALAIVAQIHAVLGLHEDSPGHGTNKECVASHVTACAELDHLQPIPESYP